MSKNLQVNLTFTADTTAAKQQMQQLQQSLTNLASQPMQSQGVNTMRTQLAEASAKAVELKIALQNATNVNTGKLNFNKFSQELQKNKTSLQQYANYLKQLGPQGSQAFGQLATAIRQSELPIISLKGKVAALGKTLANTVRWQLSSSLIMGFTRAIGSTVNYAKELNESLNNIRIVTGKSIEDMSKFAQEANKAAKALSTTTTAYTNASLIYYQQGLSDQEVKKRAETTLKLANVVSEEASTVSEWMTAIWNNFDDGSQFLEHYADVITALGAATASSADEIAGGLEKFAAVADTVGLSYEYAASALATITAETRQSEDVVGTALKTIFARIEGLNLGETLEDGTTLNKYSEALYKVGVNIKDSNGNLKDMDDILDGIGERWQYLNKDQQVALAQNVAGIRQYNQFIALMSNWDVMEENLEISKNSTGELERQQAIFEEGIEGSAARVKAQLEEIKNTLLDENDLIPLLEMADGFLEIITNLLDSLGGMPGLLIMITALVTKAFGPQIANGIASMTSGLVSMKNALDGSAAAAQKNAITQTTKMAANMAISDSRIGSNEGAAISSALKDNEQLTKSEDKYAGRLNEQYKETVSILRQIVEEKQKIIQASAQEADSAEAQGMRAETALKTAGMSAKDTNIIRSAGLYADKVDTFATTNFSSEKQAVQSAGGIVKTATNVMGEDSTQVQNLSKSYDKLVQKEHEYAKLKSNVTAKQKAGVQVTKEEIEQLNKAKTARNQERKNFADTAKSINVASAAKKKYANANQETDGAVEQLIEAEEKGAAATKRSEQAIKDKDAVMRQHDKTLKEGAAVGVHWSQSFVQGISTMTSVASGIMMLTNSFKTVSDAAKNGELTFSTFMGAAVSLLMSLGMFAPIITGITKAMKAQNLTGLKGLGILTAEWLMTKLSSKAKREKIRAIQAEQKEDEKANLKKIASIFFNIGEQASQGPKGWITAAISAALVAALIGVAIAVNASNKAQNSKEEEEAQRTQKYANQVSEAYDKVRESYEKLKESLENYNSAQEAIGKLQKGTLEWKQAIQEANQQVIELMDAYPELAQYVSNIEGRLMISEEGQRALLEQEGQRVTALSNIKLNAQQNAKQARYEADKKAELTTTFDTAGAWEFIGHMMGGIAAGAITGNPILATAGIGLGIYDAINNNNTEYQQSENAINALSELYLEQGEAIFADFDKTLQDLNITDTDLIDKLKDNKDVTEDLVRTNAELVEQNKIANQQKVDNLLMSQEHFITSEYGAGVQTATSKQYEKLKQQSIDDLGDIDDYRKGKRYTLGIAKGSTEKGEDVFKEYAEAMGYKDADATDFKGDKLFFKYKNEDDAWVEENEVTYEDMRDAVAEYRVAKQAADLANKTNQMTSQVRMLQNSNAQDQALGSFLEHGNLGYLDPEVYDEITADGFSISTEQAELFGMTVEEATEKFKKAYDAYDPILARNNILAQQQQAINITLADGAAELEQSETALRAYAETLADNSEYLNENKEAAAKMAVAHYRTAIGISELKKALNDNLKVLKDSSANSLDYAEALGSVKDSLEKAFGVKVSADFVKKNLGKIEDMANGSTEALRALRKELVIDTISNMALDDSYKTALQSELTELMEIAENSPIGMKLDLDNSKAIEGINEALKAGTMTVQEVEALFANANLALPQYNTAKVPHTTTSTSNTVSEIDQWWGKQTVTSKSTTSTTTWSEIPYFGDNPPQYDENGDQIKGTGIENSLKVSTTSNKQADEDIVNYGGKGTAAGESSTDKAKRAKELDNEIKRYRLLDETVEDLERDLDNLRKAKDRAYGNNKLAYMKQEQEMLKQNVELSKERLQLAEQYYQEDLAELGKYGITTNENGQVINWDERLQAQIDKMKGMSDPNSEAYKQEKQKLDDMKKAYDNYMQSLDDVKDAQQEIIDTQNAVVDSLLEEAEFTVEFKIEADEFTMSVLEHFLSRMEDDAFAAADAIALIGQQMEVTAGQIDTYMTGINKVLGATLSPEEIQKVMAGDLSNIDTSKLTEQQIEDLKEYANGLMEVENQLHEQHTAVHEKLTETIEAWNEEFDKNMAKFEKYNAVVENYKNIIDIVGKGTLGISDETMRNMYEAQKNIATDQLEAARIRKESAQTTYNEMKIAYDNAVMQYGEDSEIAKKWKEQMDIAEESLDEATSEFQDAWQNALQAAADAFQHNVETIIQNFEKSIAGIYGSLEGLEEAFDRQKEINERYLEDYEKTYEINKLNRKINQDIAKTTSNKSTKELRDLQNELLNMNKEGNQISKLDIEYMQKKYDLLLAEQALRDAQNAKSTVKLSRDSEGNYSYVYTADQNNVDQAMQSYEDAKYALEDWSRTSLETVSENIIQIYSAWSQAMQEIMMDNTLNEEERERKMAETNQYYLELMGYYTDEATKLTEYGYQTNSQYHIDMADSINDSIVGHIMPDITNWKELYTKSSTLMQGSTTALDKLIKQFAIDVDEAMNKAGISTGKFETLATEDLRNVETQAGATKNAITKIKTEAEAQLPLAVSAVQAFEIDFNGYMDLIIQKIGDPTGGGVLGAIQKLINGCKEGLRAQKALEEKDYSYTGEATTPQTTTPQTTGTGGGLTKQDSLEADGTTYYKLSDNNWYAKENVELYDDGTYNPTGAAREWQFDGEIDLNSDNEFKSRLNYNSTKQTSITFGTFGQLYGDPVTIRDEKGQPWRVQPGAGQFMYPYFEGAKISKYSGSLINGMRLYEVQPSSKYPQISKSFYISQGELNALLGNRAGFQAYKAYNLTPYYSGGGGSFGGTGAGRSFDTGGYTGEWGPEGRLAMLHQKEIVLNAHDTENLLSIVSMVRDMNDRIELNARAMQYGLTAAYTANNIKSQNDTLQQEVHITAEFPNATNHSEIEEAFRNLTNLASQYANRKF